MILHSHPASKNTDSELIGSWIKSSILSFYLSNPCDSDGDALCCLDVLTSGLQSHDLQAYSKARNKTL